MMLWKSLFFIFGERYLQIMVNLMTNFSSEERTVYTVSQFNRNTRILLETNFSQLWIEGEISNFREPSSGHWYFSLKDVSAQIRCAMFRMRIANLAFQAKDGMHVLIRARASLYEERGEFQLIVDYMEETGDGALRRSFELLKKRLAAEGLFATELKKTLPILPHCIGVITSATGAAIRDILTVLKRRFASIPIIIYPTQVQGALAANQIVQAISLANTRMECDVLILARGGGSLEDLWCFNEEIVVRAIYQSHIPMVSGIGHEIDFTIADFVVDQRASTPSAAAELVSPHASDYLKQIQNLQNRLIRSFNSSIRQLFMRIESLQKRLPHPKKRLEIQSQQLDSVEQRLLLAYKHTIRHQQADVHRLFIQLQRHTPEHLLQILFHKMSLLDQRLGSSFKHYFQHADEKLLQLMRALDNVSPLNTLKRGYAIATKDKHVLLDTKQVALEDRISVRLNEGKLECVVVDVD